MLNEQEQFYLKHEEDVNACLQALRSIILSMDKEVTAAWKYGMPMFCYKGKMFCYIWTHKKTGQPYLGIVEGKHIEHPKLIQEKRARMKIMLFDADKDLPVKTIKSILKQAIDLYKTGKIATK
ncbi:MAG: DUF1801 domain-containing protein [Filimonas sp.]|nr:DUF1801 domain-containing protein [Filimonas sp.]